MREIKAHLYQPDLHTASHTRAGVRTKRNQARARRWATAPAKT